MAVAVAHVSMVRVKLEEVGRRVSSGIRPMALVVVEAVELVLLMVAKQEMELNGIPHTVREAEVVLEEMGLQSGQTADSMVGVRVEKEEVQINSLMVDKE
jgi:hypothetical protein